MSLSRKAFTLLELLLVLAIIGALSAIMVPSLTGFLERQKLVNSVEDIRVRFDEARVEAMRTGQTQVFECVPGTGTFSFKPLVLQSDILNASEGATVMAAGGNMLEMQDYGMMGAADTSEGQTETLEEEVVFRQCLVASDARAYGLAQDSQLNMANPSGLATNNVGQKILFYPDGSTSTAELQIQSKKGEVQAVQIRGLTGHTRTLSVLSVASEISS